MRLAIIGAGLAGLAAARTLRQQRPDLAITIYEKSRGLGGRAATRRRAGYVFDHGAQYAKAPTPELARLLNDELPATELRDIGKPVWVFDGAGVIAQGDADQNADPKWTYADGLSRLGKLLGADLDVQREVRIGSVRASDAASPSYELFDVAGQSVGAADLILFTPPAPQTADLLRGSDLAPVLKANLLAELEPVSYRRCISLALAYNRRIERPFYALVNTDRAHLISWLAFEHDKAAERCPPDQSLLIAQMAPQWSLDHWETPQDELAPIIAQQVSALLGEDLHAPLWSDVQRWRFALPDGTADFARLNDASRSLFFAGDYTTGQGRVHLAIESGWRVASEIAQAL